VRIKSKEEVQVKSEMVQAKIVKIKGKLRQGHYEGTEGRQAAKRQRRLDQQQEVLALPAPVGQMTTLREWRVLKLHEAA
jgi:hypothetical protein